MAFSGIHQRLINGGGWHFSTLPAQALGPLWVRVESHFWGKSHFRGFWQKSRKMPFFGQKCQKVQKNGHFFVVGWSPERIRGRTCFAKLDAWQLFHVIGCACTHVASRRPRSWSIWADPIVRAGGFRFLGCLPRGASGQVFQGSLKKENWIVNI